MKPDDKRLAALQRYHAQRPEMTRKCLREAIDRMETGSPVILPPGFKWTKKNVAIEAGISVHTLLGKDRDTKEWNYPDAISRIDEIKSARKAKPPPDDYKEQKIDELRQEMGCLKQDKLNMAREIDRLGLIILELKEKVSGYEELEEQNAQLREENRQLTHPQLKILDGRYGDGRK